MLNLVEATSGEAVADWLRREGLWGERPNWKAMWGWFEGAMPGGACPTGNGCVVELSPGAG